MTKTTAPGGTPIRTMEKTRARVDDLHPHPRNPRKITPARLEQLQRTLESDPGMLEARPLIALLDGTVVAGNQRLAAARALGWETVPVVFADLSEAEVTRWMLLDNRGFGEDDRDAVAALLGELEAAGADLALTGYDVGEIDSMLRELHRPAGAPDVTPPLPAEPRSLLGEVYELGPHRLVCGDSTDRQLVERLMAGYQIDLVVTDPPYGVDYEEKAHALESSRGKTDHRRAEIAGDTLAGLRDVLSGAFAIAYDLAPSGAPICIWHADTHAPLVRAAYEQAGWLHKQTLIWVKNHLVLGRQDYQWRHEPCAYGWKSGAAHRWYGGMAETTTIDETIDPAKLTKKELVALARELLQAAPTSVIHHDKPQTPLHPTMKPVALVERLIRNSSRRGDAIYDPFGGAGSTLIAADTVGRRGYLVEIDPGYCDVIRQRYADYTNQPEYAP